VFHLAGRNQDGRTCGKPDYNSVRYKVNKRTQPRQAKSKLVDAGKKSEC